MPLILAIIGVAVASFVLTVDRLVWARRHDIVSLLRDCGRMRAPEIAERLGMWVGPLYPVLRRLERKGVLWSYEVIGPGNLLAQRGRRSSRVYLVRAAS